MKRKKGQFRPVKNSLSILLLGATTLGEPGGCSGLPGWWACRTLRTGTQELCLVLPHLPTTPLCCPPLPAWARVDVTCPGDWQRPGGSGTHCRSTWSPSSPVHPPCTHCRKSTGSRSQRRHQGHVLSKCPKQPQGPAPHREWKPGRLRNRHSPATMDRHYL